MTIKSAIQFVRQELNDLDVPENTRAYDMVYHNAIEGAEIMTKKELRQYIVEYIDLLPSAYFEL